MTIKVESLSLGVEVSTIMYLMGTVCTYSVDVKCVFKEKSESDGLILDVIEPATAT